MYYTSIHILSDLLKTAGLILIAQNEYHFGFDAIAFGVMHDSIPELAKNHFYKTEIKRNKYIQYKIDGYKQLYSIIKKPFKK